MEELYALAYKGNMTYFAGRISLDQIERIDKMLETRKKMLSELTTEHKQQRFLNIVSSELGLNLAPIGISHVFRL